MGGVAGDLSAMQKPSKCVSSHIIKFYKLFLGIEVRLRGHIDLANELLYLSTT